MQLSTALPGRLLLDQLIAVEYQFSDLRYSREVSRDTWRSRRPAGRVLASRPRRLVFHVTHVVQLCCIHTHVGDVANGPSA